MGITAGPGRHVPGPLLASGHKCSAPLASLDATRPQYAGSTHNDVTFDACPEYWVPATCRSSGSSFTDI